MRISPAGWLYDSLDRTREVARWTAEEFKIMSNGRLLETMERSQVYREAHEGAILINKGETYTVDNVNLKSGYVNVSKKNVDYHTMVLNDTDVNVVSKEFKKQYGDLTIHFGELNVKKDYYKYKKMQHSRVLGMYSLDLPPLKFKTKGLEKRGKYEFILHMVYNSKKRKGYIKGFVSR